MLTAAANTTAPRGYTVPPKKKTAAGEKKDKGFTTISARLPDDVYAKLHELSESESLSVSWIVGRLIRDCIDDLKAKMRADGAK